MIKLNNVQIWVRDQDEALDFYTKKVGWEVRSDMTMPEMGDFRWLVVGPGNQPDVSIALMAVPGPPVMDEQTRQQVLDLTAKGFTGTLFLTTDDVGKQHPACAAALIGASRTRLDEKRRISEKKKGPQASSEAPGPWLGALCGCPALSRVQPDGCQQGHQL
jgi:catechol 2,3-dioxygenase-like lactoylglutathione lyase family enzyme